MAIEEQFGAEVAYSEHVAVADAEDALRDYVSRLCPEDPPEVRRRHYERLKRQRSRALSLIRPDVEAAIRERMTETPFEIGRPRPDWFRCPRSRGGGALPYWGQESPEEELP